MKQYLSTIRCPLCYKHIFMRQGSLICKKGHCFDLAKQGYVNFQAARDATYSKELFESRQRIYEAGFYRPLTDALDALIKELVQKPSPLILDAGCGEGFFLSEILKGESVGKIGFDISKDAIRLAAAKGKDTLWLVADINNIPIKNGTVDVLLDILTPANYAEFSRVLTKGGLLIKVLPGADYLKELRELLQGELQSDDYSNERTKDYFLRHAKLVTEQRLSYQVNLTPALALDFARMTPMTEHIQIDSLPIGKLSKMTIELDILVGRFA